jgi:hypothetical protein
MKYNLQVFKGPQRRDRGVLTCTSICTVNYGALEGGMVIARVLYYVGEENVGSFLACFYTRLYRKGQKWAEQVWEYSAVNIGLLLQAMQPNGNPAFAVCPTVSSPMSRPLRRPSDPEPTTELTGMFKHTEKGRM